MASTNERRKNMATISESTAEPSTSTASPPAFRAAQYVRMSTEHQQYSTNNQADKIREYAERRNIQIVQWDGLLPPEAASECQTGSLTHQSKERRRPP